MKRKGRETETTISNKRFCRTRTPKTTILDLPVEVLQNICYFLPFASDVISLSLVGPKFYTFLNDNYFWFLFRRTIDTGPRIYERWKKGRGPLSYKKDFHGEWLQREAADLVKRELTEDYDESKNYMKLAWTAVAGNTGLREEKRAEDSEGRESLRRCQICCIRNTEEHRNGFGLFICTPCYRSYTIVHWRVAFLNLDERRIRGKPNGRLWLPDVQREVTLSYPGRTLESLLEERNLSEIVLHYGHESRLIDSLMEHWALPEYNNFREVLPTEIIKIALYKFAESATRRLEIEESEGLHEQPQSWVDRIKLDFFSNFMTNIKRFRCIRDQVLEFHEQRFTHELGYGLEFPSDPEYLSPDGKVTIGMCSICYHNGCGYDQPKPIVEPEDCIALVPIWTPENLVHHYFNCHTREALQRGPDGKFFQFLNGVPGTGPVRVSSRTKLFSLGPTEVMAW